MKQLNWIKIFFSGNNEAAGGWQGRIRVQLFLAIRQLNIFTNYFIKELNTFWKVFNAHLLKYTSAEINN